MDGHRGSGPRDVLGAGRPWPVEGYPILRLRPLGVGGGTDGHMRPLPARSPRARPGPGPRRRKVTYKWEEGMYEFEQKFRALDEITVDDPLGLGTRWTIRRAGLVGGGKRGGGGAVEAAMMPAIKRLAAYELAPAAMRKAMGPDGAARVLEGAAESIDFAALLDSEATVADTVERVIGVEPLIVVDSETGKREQVPSTAERIREILTLSAPVPADVVVSVLGLRPADLEGCDPEDVKEAERRHRAFLDSTNTLGRLFTAWVRRVSEDTERFREAAVEDGEKKLAGGAAG